MVRTIRIAAIALGILGSSVGAQTFEIVYSFPATGENGRRPLASLSLGPDGNIYGTTSQDGAFDGGTAFRIWTNGTTRPEGPFEVVGHFNPATTGQTPVSKMINIGDGFLYGVTRSNAGVPGGSKGGTLYKLNPSATASQENLEGALTWIFQVPSSPNTDPYTACALTLGESNAIYVLCNNLSGIWRVPLENPENSSVLRFFDDPSVDGEVAHSITRGWDGYIYGTTEQGETSDGSEDIAGTIFRLDPLDPENDASMVRLHECNDATGTIPQSSLIQLPDGNFYGTMGYDGDRDAAGCIFRISPDGDFSVVYSFRTPKGDELYEPKGELLYGSDGFLYGCTHFGGGKGGYGGVYRIRPNGKDYKVLHRFSGPDGGYPDHGLAQGPDGYIYGTTFIGGEHSEGTVFRIKLNLPDIPENRPPAALDDIVLIADQEKSFDVRANDFDPDGDGLIVSIANAPAHGTAAIAPGGLIRYTPGNTYDGEDEFTYSISDGQSEPKTATVRIRNTMTTPLVQEGVYSGLLHLDPDLELEFGSMTPQAQYTLKVSDKGRFTGTLLTQGKRLSLRGTFDDAGTAEVQVKIPKKGTATLFLSFQQQGESNTITGILSGEVLASGTASAAQNSGFTKKQLYTIDISATSGVAEGAGYGTMTVQPNGSVTIKGKLGDGSTLSWSSTLVEDLSGMKFIPVFSEPLPGGLCAGYLSLVADPEEGTDFQGTIHWIRPGSDPGMESINAGLYVPPTSKEPVLDLPGGRVLLSGGPLGPMDVTEGDFTLSGQKVTVTDDLRSLTFNRATGLFSGKMKVENKTVSFSGAINQGRKDGVGQFRIGKDIGKVSLLPPLPIP